MKIGIVSDTHSNSFATKVVLEHMKSVGVDKKVHLGDVVGYGPRPSETLELTLENFNYIIKGNHDFACENDENTWGFNPQAKAGIEYTVKNLSKEEIDVLASLPYQQKLGDALFTHGSPHAPFDYIIDHNDAKLGFSNPNFQIAFVGHTHVPFLWSEQGFARPTFTNKGLNDYGMIGAFEFIVPKELRLIVNVGSVGQSRDGDSRATYCIYDTESRKVTIYKVPYSVEIVVGQMQRAGFDEKSWSRLIYGR